MTADVTVVRDAAAKQSKSSATETATSSASTTPVAAVLTAAAPEYETIKIDRRERVGLITLYRPKTLNALNVQLSREVLAALKDFDRDDRIGAIVITGSARAFAA